MNATPLLESFLLYLRHERRFSSHTVLAYQNDLQQFFTYVEKQHDLPVAPQRVEYGHVKSWIVHLLEGQGLKERTVNRKLAALSAFYRYLEKNDMVKGSPTDAVKALRTPQRVPQFVSEEDMGKLFERVQFPEGYAGDRDRLALELLYGTGIRQAELIRLTVDQIDFAAQTLRIQGKGNKERIIPLHRPLNAFLRQYVTRYGRRNDDPIITTDKGAAAYPMFVQRLVKKYLTLVTSLQQKSPHVLRHTFATHLLNNGADLNAIKMMLGHSSLAATQVYTSTSLDRMKAVYDQAHPKSGQDD